MASKQPPASPRGTEEQPQSQPSHPEQQQAQQQQQQQQTAGGTAAAQMQAGPRPPKFRDWASI